MKENDYGYDIALLANTLFTLQSSAQSAKGVGLFMNEDETECINIYVFVYVCVRARENEPVCICVCSCEYVSLSVYELPLSVLSW